MSVEIMEVGRERNMVNRAWGRRGFFRLEESQKDLVLRDLTSFVLDSDLSLCRIAQLLRVSDVTLSMWIAGTTRPSNTKRCEIKDFLQTTA